ncbi:MAG: protein-disulfide reductase DsbD family protein [Terriglobales bacterium]
MNSNRATNKVACTMGRIVAVVVLCCAAMHAQSEPQPVKLSLGTSRGSVASDAAFDALLTAHIADGWHLYSTEPMSGGPTSTRIGIPPGQPFRLAGDIVSPDPQIAFDPNFEMNVAYYEGEATFRIPVKAAGGAGKQTLTADVVYQTCNDHMCLPPRKVSVSAAVIIAAVREVGAPPTAKPVTANSPSRTPGATIDMPRQPATMAAAAVPSEVPSAKAPPSTIAVTPPTFNTIQTNSFRSFLWLAIAMGALSLLTPCVFPMVPITVSYFSNHGSGTRHGAVRQALIYGVGIILTFTALGLALALIFGAGGVNQLAANPWVNLLITAIFFAFAFSLFGAYFIQVPSGWMNKIDAITRSKEGSRVVGALLMGGTFTLTSFTCTAPFVGTLLVMAARGNWRWPLAGMLAYSTVFALPFFLLALAPQLVSQLPRAGGWMNAVKVVMGFLEIAAAMKFLSNADLVWHWGVFTRETVLAIWIACGIAIVLYIFGLVRFEHDEKVEHLGAVRLIAALTFLAITIALVPGLFGRRLGELDSFLPPSSAELGIGTMTAEASSGEIKWLLNDYNGALTTAKQQNKLVFIDFTGYTCTNCRWMEANMFPKPEVKSELEKFVTVRLYTDGAGTIYEKQQKMQQDNFGTVALPLYAIVRPDGTSVATFPGLTRKAAEFVSFLKQGRPAASGT